MTATDPRTLDALLAAADPTDTEPFDVASTIALVQSAPSFGDRANAQVALMDHIQGLSDGRESARRWAVALEQECADKDRRIADAVRWLELAASFSVTEDCDAAIHDAMTALRGAE